jgi:hypothetical protein
LNIPTITALLTAIQIVTTASSTNSLCPLYQCITPTPNNKILIKSNRHMLYLIQAASKFLIIH